MRRVLADSGFLVALGIERDPRYRAARDYLDNYHGEMLVPAPVVTESCDFLSTAGKVRLLDWLRKIPRKVLDLPTYAYPDVSFAQLDVKELALTFRVGVVYRKDAYLSPLARRFIEILRSTAPETGKVTK